MAATCPIMVMLAVSLCSILSRCRRAAYASSSLLSSQILNQALSTAVAALSILKTVDDISSVDRSVLLILLVCPPLNSGLVQVLLLKRAQERLYLLLDLIVRFLLSPLNDLKVVT